jgi:hypothetical protein
MSGTNLLEGAYDLHLHCAPDVVARAQGPLALARAVHEAGMWGALLKDHTGSTVGLAAALNELCPSRPRFFGSLVLNPPVGGLNPLAVEAALREGADVIFLPTYGARHQIETAGPDAFPAAFPRPGAGWEGLSVLDEGGAVRAEVGAILELIAAHDAVLATGHVGEEEVRAVLALGREVGVRRMLVNHVSEPVPEVSLETQREAAKLGAFVEHCVMAVKAGMGVTAEGMVEQIRALGAAHVVISSDLGQPVHGPPVRGFAEGLEGLLAAGLSEAELRTAIAENPRRLVEDREPPAG